MSRQSEAKEINSSYTDEIVCPYCGHEFLDSWEYDFDHGDIELDCYECGNKFTAYRDVDVTYCTTKMEL